MKLPRKVLQTEGDVNISERRQEWQAGHISEEAFRLLDEDAELYVHQSMSTPCLNVVEKSYGIYIEDIDGRAYMDFHGNSAHQVGYGNEYVIQAVKKQLDLLPFSPRRYTNRAAIDLAKKLTSLAPGSLNKVLFAPGGTSALSMALKLVRKATGKFKTISMWDSFHGASLDAISVGGDADFRNGMGPLLPGTIHVPPYNSYRSEFGGSNTAFSTLDYIEYILERENEVGAIILEPVRCTDVQIPPRSYHQRLRSICDQYDVKLIYDEIPTGLGRTGKMFTFEHYGVEPDIVLLGKGLGGGVFPMAAMLAREDLDIAQDISLGHFTHEKSSLGCAAGLACIEYIEEQELLLHTVQMENFMKNRLNSMAEKYPLIGDIRGVGLLYGVELVKNQETKEKATAEAEEIMYECMTNGLSFKVSQGNVLTLAPPLIITEAELEQAMQVLEAAISKVVTT
ncbi:aspartate aminotransferase family protein [Bacillus piscicola]|uniref:aspartate aminotransferase family protein n=1 Tax=Bacillus piscicola TaxID=1632684 RepID=UPI001F09321A|nr:aspartate aminotransferase family protein [Bacillus piscicola]